MNIFSPLSLYNYYVLKDDSYMKKNLVSILLGLIPLGLTSCGLKMSVYPDAEKYTAGNIEYSDVEVNTIDIVWLSGSLTLVEDEDATGITISEDTDLIEKEALVHSYFHDGILSVKYFYSGYWCNTFNYKKDLTITYKPGLDSLKVSLTSGSLKAESIHAKEFDLNLTSGFVDISSLVSEKADTDLTSGSVIFGKVVADEFDVDMTSGKAVVNYEAINKSSFSLTSGEIVMTLPSDGGTVKVSKTSGSVKTNREGTFSKDTYQFGEGSAQIKVSMTSGTLTIN